MDWKTHYFKDFHPFKSIYSLDLLQTKSQPIFIVIVVLLILTSFTMYIKVHCPQDIIEEKEQDGNLYDTKYLDLF